MRHELWRLDPATYVRHHLHQNERAWPLSNCAVDLWIELLHTAGADPMPALAFTLASDFEGDQWTFFKFPLADLSTLYGIEVFELNVWRPLVAHIEEQLALGRLCIVEVDAFHLPDTAGTSYRTDHVKTSIGIQMLDAGMRRLGYFHNDGYYELDRQDFTGLFRHDEPGSVEWLPPYVEVAKVGSLSSGARALLLNRSLDVLRAHLARSPRTNPFRRASNRMLADLRWLTHATMEQFHRYAFATFRQYGAAFELAAVYVRWLGEHGECGLEQVAERCDLIASTAKALQFKTARMVHTQRPFDPIPMLETMARAWDDAMIGLTERYGALAPQG